MTPPLSAGEVAGAAGPSMPDSAFDQIYREHRRRLLGIAYRMLSRVSDAEDVVQEAFLRLRTAASAQRIKNPAAFLTTVTTRLAIDRSRSAAATREQYVGPWLPEPLLTDGRDGQAPDPAVHAEMADSLSMAFLLLLEFLGPTERAVLLLRDVFGYSSQDVAALVGISDVHCRQMLVRARRRVADGRPRFEADRARRDELVAQFLRACEGGDLDDFLALLADDAVLYNDGGGKVMAAVRPVHGRHRVATFLIRVMRRHRGGRALRATSVNGQPGVLWLEGDHVVGVMVLDVVPGGLQAVRVVLNPDKLEHAARQLV